MYGGAIISEYCISGFGLRYTLLSGFSRVTHSMASGVKRSDDYEVVTWIDCIGIETTLNGLCKGSLGITKYIMMILLPRCVAISSAPSLTSPGSNVAKAAGVISKH